MFKKLLLASALFIPGLVFAQSVFNQAAIPNQVTPRALNLTGAPSSTVAIFTAGSKGGMCWGGMLNTNDQTLTHLITLSRTISGVTANYTSFTTVNGLPANTLGAPINLFSVAALGANNPIFPINQSGNQAMEFGPGDSWGINWVGTITATNSIGVTAECANFQ